VAQAQTTATPTISAASGISPSQFSVTVSDATTGATMYYTLDGTTPTSSSPTIGAGVAIPITQTETLNVFATASGYADSPLATATYQVTNQVATGGNFTVALKSDGSVWVWGLNSSGQLGDGSTTTRSSPEKLTTANLLNPTHSPPLSVIAVSAGAYHTLALRSDKTVWAWGLNTNGQLGDNTTTQRNAPVQVMKSDGSGGTTALTNIIAICAGYYHSLALDGSGNLWAWGLDSSGQLGDNMPASQQKLAQIVGGLTSTGVTVTEIGAGEYHSLAVTSDGKVWAWGDNNTGQLGDGTTTQRNTPVVVNNIGTAHSVPIVQIVGGENHSMALDSNNTVWTWGLGTYGELGNNSTAQQNSPIHLTSLSSISQIAAGQLTGMAMQTDGPVWTWGWNTNYPDLGDGTDINRTGPTLMLGVNGAATIAMSGFHTVVLKDDGTAWVCGENVQSQLGNGFIPSYNSFVQVLPSMTFTGIADGLPLLIKPDTTLWGIGDDNYGDLGNGATLETINPVQVGTLTGVTNVSGGAETHGFAVSGGKVYGWGNNTNGVLGASVSGEQHSPVQVGATTTGFNNIQQVYSGYQANFALKSDNTVWGWGMNGVGQIGDGTTTTRTTPVQIQTDLNGNPFTGITALSNGTNYTLALKSDKTVWAWGVNSNGELGDGTTTGRYKPVEVMKSDGSGGTTPLTNIVQVLAGQGSEYYSLALDSSGNVWAWGANSSWWLGDGTTTEHHIAEELTGVSNVTALAGQGASFTIAFKSDGTVWGWGPNWSGAMAQGNGTAHPTPVSLSNFQGVVALTGMEGPSLALKEDGHLEGAGSDLYCALGTGNWATPFPVPGFNTNATVSTPTVSMTATSSTTTVSQASTITFTATPSTTAAGTSVSYYYYSNLIGTSTTSSNNYGITWVPPTWGSYTFTAIVTDPNGYTSYRSAPVTVNVPYDSDLNSSGVQSGNGLPDWWELKWGIFGQGYTSTSNIDGNVNSLYADYKGGANPFNYFSYPGTNGVPSIITPLLTKASSGDNQSGPTNTFLPNPLSVTVKDSSGNTLANAPITFSAAGYMGGLLSTSLGGTTSQTISMTTNSSGVAQVYCVGASLAGATMPIQVTCGSGTTSFTETTFTNTGALSAPSNFSVSSPSSDQYAISWTNNASSATYILVQQTTDGGRTWVTLASLSPTATSYTATVSDTSKTYYFGVIAGTPP
jgi:alpha-tubulin suppressor-like RCC1 family protein